LDELTLDAEIQPRETMASHVIAEYAALYREGHDLSAILVFFDGDVHWLADGFHRVCAARQAGLRRLPAEVRQGDKRDAMLYACEANKHGKLRTNADKRRVVLRLLTDPEWCQWSAGVIAQHCGVSGEFVRKIKHQLATSLPTVGSDQKQNRIYIDLWGHTGTMDTSAIGRSTPPSLPPDTMDVTPPPDDVPRAAMAAVWPPAPSTPVPPTQKQLDYLAALGDSGPPPVSRTAASARIDLLKRGGTIPAGMPAEAQEGFVRLMGLWFQVNEAARREFQRWLTFTHPCEDDSAAAQPEAARFQSHHYAAEIARICGEDTASVG
jgi:hypothetical protein